MNEYLRFHAPTTLIAELDKHRGVLAKRAQLDEEQFDSVTAALLERIHLHPVTDWEPWWDEAARTMVADPDDVPYLACALAVGADAIWSHDPHFDAQDLVPRVTNADLLALP